MAGPKKKTKKALAPKHGPTVVDLPARADLSQSEALKQLFKGVIDEDGQLGVDASKVEFISTPCFQILLSAARTASQVKRPFEISGPSKAFLDAARDLGLTDAFAEWSMSK